MAYKYSSPNSALGTGGFVPHTFNMIENYIYLYHTDTMIMLPSYPTTIGDNMGATFSSSTPLARSAPIFSYANSGPRHVTFVFNLHRELMEEINYGTSNASVAMGDDYTDTLIKQIQAIALPKYSSGDKMVNPPIVAVRVGSDIFVKGVCQGGVTTTYGLPIITDANGNEKYATVDIQFTVEEIEPYDAELVMSVGGFRGLSSTNLDRSSYVPSNSNESAQSVSTSTSPNYAAQQNSYNNSWSYGDGEINTSAFGNNSFGGGYTHGGGAGRR